MLEILGTEFKSEYLYAEVAGDFDIKKSGELFEEVMNICIDRGYSNILFDCRRLEGEVSILDRYKFGIFMDSERTRKTNIAFVSTSKYILPNKFLETVAKNRAINVKVTADIDEAELWLSSTNVDEKELKCSNKEGR